MEFICMVLEIITIMRDLHDTGVVHRDIKPENFVLDTNKKIYIIDFGLSCIQSERELTQFIGNKRYASYNCHLPSYTYQKKDDIISVIYMLIDLYKHRLPWDSEVNYEIKKNVNFHEFYKKKDYFLNILFMMYDNVDNPGFYKLAIDELSRTVDYCKAQGK
jgi:serine/threonine protein kinase